MTFTVHDIVGIPIGVIHQAPWNANKVTPDTLEKVRKSLERYGSVENNVVRPSWCVGTRTRAEVEVRRAALMGDEEGYETLSGNHRLTLYKQAGVEKVPCAVVDLPDPEAKLLAQTLNRTRGAEDDPDRLRALLRDVVSDIPVLDVAALLPEAGLTDFLKPTGPGRQTSAADGGVAAPKAPDPEAGEKILSQRGELYELGPHRLICGDCTDHKTVEMLLEGDRNVGCIITDPPYCSGGFQEAGRAKGSVGTDAEHKPVANDTLSTRGYQALMRAFLNLIDARCAYIFTDWRMWVNLFDLVESCGYGVRSMVVWDKGRPGMGRGWRAQHELVLCGIRDTKIFADMTQALGNVRSHPRTGNKHHTTEKPVPLLRDLLKPIPTDVGIIYDPFAGSGSTALACHDRPCRMIELDPAYCDVIRQRWGEYARQQGLEPGKDAL